MKIKSLLLSLALLGSIVGYAQSHDSELYRVPARKEIRHKVQQLSEFPVEQPVVTRASGEYIMIRVSLTKEGKIIDCLTISEEETDGIGSACADEAFYGQFDGKTEENYSEIDAIGGATMTTNGYMKAIERAFSVVKIFEGGEK